MVRKTSRLRWGLRNELEDTAMAANEQHPIGETAPTRHPLFFLGWLQQIRIPRRERCSSKRCEGWAGQRVSSRR